MVSVFLFHRVFQGHCDRVIGVLWNNPACNLANCRKPAPGCQGRGCVLFPCPYVSVLVGQRRHQKHGRAVASLLDAKMPQGRSSRCMGRGDQRGARAALWRAAYLSVSCPCPALRGAPAFSWPHPQNAHRARKAPIAEAPSPLDSPGHRVPLRSGACLLLGFSFQEKTCVP